MTVTAEGTDPSISIALTTTDEQQYGWTAPYVPAQEVLPLSLAIGPSDWRDVPLFSRRFQHLQADRITPATTYPRFAPPCDRLRLPRRAVSAP
ncbi:hypothetical protein [Streptomyces sp. NPDC048332]|uniref:hypothetical protein n=1 Tax=Streptomyces sp. NPDC048332 TaxID=3154619 RepID=UPI00341E911C